LWVLVEAVREVDLVLLLPLAVVEVVGAVEV
jgi:hypothetical protein